MLSNTELIKRITDIAESDGRYSREGFLFVLAGLEYTLAKMKQRRHLTGQELSLGIAGYARDQYGYLALTVLNGWGIYTTMDFGEIVYLLIEAGVMNKTEEDSKEDFLDAFDFEDEFNWEKTRPRTLPERF